MTNPSSLLTRCRPRTGAGTPDSIGDPIGTPTGRTRRRSHWPPASGEPVLLIITLSAVCASLSPGEPTSLGLMNIMLRACCGACVAALTSRARRWSWFPLCGLAAVASLLDPVAMALGLASLAITVFGTVFSSRLGMHSGARQRAVGALVGTLAVQSLLRSPHYSLAALVPIAALVCVAVVAISAYRVGSQSFRRRFRRSITIASIATATISVAFGVGAYRASIEAGKGAALARQGIAAAIAGDEDQAVTLLARADRRFAAAQIALERWWIQPARALPLIGPNFDTTEALAQTGRRLSTGAIDVASATDLDGLARPTGGIDIDQVTRLLGPMERTDRTLTTANRSLINASSPWVVPPLDSERDRLHAELLDLSERIDFGRSILRALPIAFGADEPALYLVLFGTPSETRFLGGFIGNWALVSATDGRLELVETSRVGALIDTSGNRTLTGTDSYVSRYGDQYRPDVWFQNVTASPDFPSVAGVAADLFSQSTGLNVDGIMYLDPYAVQALVGLLDSPIVVEDNTMLDGTTTAAFLLRDQYAQFPSSAERKDFLEVVTEQAFQRLLKESLPGPEQLSAAFGPLARTGRIQMHSFDPVVQDLFERIGVDGAFPTSGGEDVISLRTANANPNKIDAYLRRDIDYQVDLDPVQGLVRATARVILTNDAPTGLSDYVIGNDYDEPEGANRMHLSFYSKHLLETVTIDGEVTEHEIDREFGLYVYSMFVTVPRTESTTLEFNLHGDYPGGSAYPVVVSSQPVANDDAVTVSVRTPDRPWEIEQAEPATPTGVAIYDFRS